MLRAMLLGLFGVVACSTRTAPVSEAGGAHSVAEPHVVLAPATSVIAGDAVPTRRAFVLKGGIVVGAGKTNLLIEGERIAGVGVSDDAAARVVNVTGRFVVPAFIDSHVHLAYFPDGAAELPSSGIAAVLDLAAPVNALGVDHAPLRVINAGPMITAVAGYPTNSWGANGYGIGVATAAAGVAAVETLFKAGVGAIKVPLTVSPTLDDATVKAIVAAAHAHQLKVYTHALEEKNAARAAADGIDVLAHTPTEALSEATLDAWKSRTVISTLGAFGGGMAALDNLRKLRERGARVLYGTDFGNTRQTGVQDQEISYLMTAGFDGASIVAAGTTVPAAFLGLTDLGSLEVGKRASFMVLAADPRVDPHTLAKPIAVYMDGVMLSAGL